jgi:hypothetical protein
VKISLGPTLSPAKIGSVLECLHNPFALPVVNTVAVEQVDLIASRLRVHDAAVVAVVGFALLWKLPCITTWDDSRNQNHPTDSAEEAH